MTIETGKKYKIVAVDAPVFDGCIGRVGVCKGVGKLGGYQIDLGKGILYCSEAQLQAVAD